MKIIMILVFALLFLANRAFSKPKADADSTALKPVIMYLAGIEILESDPKLSDTAKAIKYEQLCSLTGTRAELAIKTIERYKNNPEAWQKIQESIIKILQSIK